MARSQHAGVTPYPERFQTYVTWSIEHVLQSVPQDEGPLPVAVRDQGLHVLSFALELETAWSPTRELLITIAPKMEQAGYRDEWIPYVEKGVEVSKQIGDDNATAELNLHLGFLYRLHGQLREASEALNYSRNLFNQLQNQDGEARALYRLAFVKRIQEQDSEAQRLGLSALKLAPDRSRTKASAHSVLGAVAMDHEELEQAYHHFIKALYMWKSYKSPRMIAWCLSDLGACQWRQRKYHESIATLNEALSLFEQIADPVQQAVVLMNLGVAYISLEQYDKALKQFHQAKPIFYRANDRLRLAQINNNIGFSYQKLERWVQAEQFYKESIAMWQVLNRTYSLVNTLDGLGMVYLGQSRFATAMYSFLHALNLLIKTQTPSKRMHIIDVIGKRIETTQNAYRTHMQIDQK